MQFYMNYKEAVITPSWSRKENHHMKVKDWDTKDAEM